MKIWIVTKSWHNEGTHEDYDFGNDEFVDVYASQREAKKIIWGRYDEEVEDVMSNDNLSLSDLKEYDKTYFEGHDEYFTDKHRPIYRAEWSVYADRPEDSYDVIYEIVEKIVKG